MDLVTDLMMDFLMGMDFEKEFLMKAQQVFLKNLECCGDH
jgi:hypothetical protein